MAIGGYARLADDLLAPDHLVRMATDARKVQRQFPPVIEMLEGMQRNWEWLLDPSEPPRVRRPQESPGSRKPRSKDELADVIARELRLNPSRTRSELAQVYRPDLIRLGFLRYDSQDKTARRRMQEFLARYVYGVRIPDEELPPRVREGRKQGARRSLTPI